MDSKNDVGIPVNDAPQSQRNLLHDDIHQTDLIVSKSMQDFFYAKMSQNIATSIEFIDGSCVHKKKRRTKGEFAVKLFNDTGPVTHIDGTTASDQRKQIATPIVRRQIESSEMCERDKYREVVIDGESIIRGDDVRCWKPRKMRPHKYFNYREKKGTLFLVEPITEFSALRKKHNWSESEIAKWKKERK